MVVKFAFLQHLQKIFLLPLATVKSLEIYLRYYRGKRLYNPLNHFLLCLISSKVLQLWSLRLKWFTSLNFWSIVILNGVTQLTG